MAQPNGDRPSQAERLTQEIRNRRPVVTALAGARSPINRDRIRVLVPQHRLSVGAVDTGNAVQQARRAAKFATPTTTTTTTTTTTAPATSAAGPPQRSKADRFQDFLDVRDDIRFAGVSGDTNCRKHLRDDPGSAGLRSTYGATAEEFAEYFISRARIDDMHLDNKTEWDGQVGSEVVDTGMPQFRLFLGRVVDDARLDDWKIVAYVNRDHLALTHMGPGL